MSPRYYFGTAILVVVLTLVISIWTQKRTKRAIFGVMIKVVCALFVIFGGIFGIAQLLSYFGVAQSGFFLWVPNPWNFQDSWYFSWLWLLLRSLILWECWFIHPSCMRIKIILAKIVGMDGCFVWSRVPASQDGCSITDTTQTSYDSVTFLKR